MPPLKPPSVNDTLLRSFGRRRARKLRPQKQDVFDRLLPQLTVSLERVADLFTPHPSPLPGGERESGVWLEIGFGAGEHLAHQAALNPQITFVGCEPFVNGTADLLLKIEQNDLHNIRLYNDDVRPLLERIPDASLDRAFILYPDPWPKARHHKRRLIQSDFLTLLTQKMRQGSVLRIASDDYDYITWIMERVLSCPELTWQATTSDDWLIPWDDWISTRYEQKALKAGRVPTYLTCIRTS